MKPGQTHLGYVPTVVFAECLRSRSIRTNFSILQWRRSITEENLLEVDVDPQSVREVDDILRCIDDTSTRLFEIGDILQATYRRPVLPTQLGLLLFLFEFII